MYIDPYYRVVQLKSFIGEKKLKQLGLLHCQSCPPLSIVQPAYSKLDSSIAIDYIPLSTSDTQIDDVIQEVLDKYTPTTCLYKPNKSFSMFHSLESLEEPSLDTFSCPECGKRYHPLSSSLYEALPLSLSDVEADAIKGIFVDLYL